MSAILFKKNKDGVIVSEWFDPLRVAHLIDTGWSSTKEELEVKEEVKEIKPKAAKVIKKG